MSRTGILAAAALGLTLCLIGSPALCGSIPGEDIISRASLAWCAQTQLSTAASVSYVDPTGETIQQATDQPASVQVDTALSPIVSQPAASFVAPDPSSPVYFTISRSMYSGASLRGKSVKLIGKLRTNDGVQYLDDGATVTLLNPATGLVETFRSIVPVLRDLLTIAPTDGVLVTVQGVCRIESDGRPAILPLSDSAISPVQH